MNPNAVLNVLRHDDNAIVIKGAVGDLTKTVFFLDYPLFERLTYNLVVNFDVYGNIGHQFLTRIYMDMIRMEAEEIFLSFLPPQERTPLRKSWYAGFATELKMQYMFPELDQNLKTGITFKFPKRAKEEFVENILFIRMNDVVRGNLDPINWKVLQPPSSIKDKYVLTVAEKVLRNIASITASETKPFSRFLPDFALLELKNSMGDSKIYSVMHNREHQNISWILGESLRMSPQEDTLTIREGFWGAYPNMFFILPNEQIKSFANQVLKMKSKEDYQKLVRDFGVPRNQPRFWEIYDNLNANFKKTDPVQAGFLDLTRYEL